MTPKPRELTPRRAEERPGPDPSLMSPGWEFNRFGHTRSCTFPPVYPSILMVLLSVSLRFSLAVIRMKRRQRSSSPPPPPSTAPIVSLLALLHPSSYTQSLFFLSHFISVCAAFLFGQMLMGMFLFTQRKAVVGANAG